MRAQCAASTFSLIPPTGSTNPDKVILPVILKVTAAPLDPQVRSNELGPDQIQFDQPTCPRAIDVSRVATNFVDDLHKGWKHH
jgi:hypothetical protein